MGQLFRVILLLILTFIMVVFTLIFFFKPVSSSKSSSFSTSIHSFEALNEDKGSESRSNIIKGPVADVITTITVEEQKMVEKSSAQQGFVPQENGTGFYYVKEKNKFYYQNKTTD